MRRSWPVAAAIVSIPLVAYPLVSIASGPPRFPSQDECVQVATGDAEGLEVVYGRFEAPDDAEALLTELERVGFTGAETDFDGCGRWKVSYDSIDSYDQGEALAEQVRETGFQAQVEAEG